MYYVNSCRFLFFHDGEKPGKTEPGRGKTGKTETGKTGKTGTVYIFSLYSPDVMPALVRASGLRKSYDRQAGSPHKAGMTNL